MTSMCKWKFKDAFMTLVAIACEHLVFLTCRDNLLQPLGPGLTPSHLELSTCIASDGQYHYNKDGQYNSKQQLTVGHIMLGYISTEHNRD